MVGDGLTVLKVEKEKYKIILTHTEVILCFGSYEKLKGMGVNVRAAIKTLISDIIYENEKLYTTKVLVTVSSKENVGAQIFVNLKEKSICDTVVCFENGDALIEAAIILYKNGLCKESGLYKTKKGYQLILKEPSESLFVINEFAKNIKSSNILAESVKEYGKIILEENAVEKLARAFLK